MEYTPEDYTLATWLGAECVWKGGGFCEPPATPTVRHPNEVATREAVEAKVYTAEAVGL